jgi:hypothetical protein
MILAMQAWRNWIKPLRVNRLEAGTLTLETDSTLTRERVNSQYADRLRVISAAEFKTVATGVQHVEVRVSNGLARRTDRPHRMSDNKPAETKPAENPKSIETNPTIYRRDLIPDTHLPILSLANRTSWHSLLPDAPPKVKKSRLIHCFYMVVSGLAKPTLCMPLPGKSDSKTHPAR